MLGNGNKTTTIEIMATNQFDISATNKALV